MNSAERLLNDAADYIAATLEQPADTRAWTHLLIYCPKELIIQRAQALASLEGDAVERVAASSRSFTDDELRGNTPLQYFDGPDYCTVKDSTGGDFCLTVQPELLQRMEQAFSTYPTPGRINESVEFEKAWAKRPWTTTRTDKERAFYWWSARAILATGLLAGEAEPEYIFDDPLFNKGVQHVVDLIARELGVTDWVAGDGSEDYDCDLWQTILNILAEKRLYDADEGEFAVVSNDELEAAIRADERERCAKEGSRK